MPLEQAGLWKLTWTDIGIKITMRFALESAIDRPLLFCGATGKAHFIGAVDLLFGAS